MNPNTQKFPETTPTRVYVSKKSAKNYTTKIVDDREEIDLDNPIEFQMTKYKKTGENNSFSIYELKTKYK